MRENVKKKCFVSVAQMSLILSTYMSLGIEQGLISQNHIKSVTIFSTTLAFFLPLGNKSSDFEEKSLGEESRGCDIGPNTKHLMSPAEMEKALAQRWGSCVTRVQYEFIPMYYETQAKQSQTLSNLLHPFVFQIPLWH